MPRGKGLGVVVDMWAPGVILEPQRQSSGLAPHVQGPAPLEMMLLLALLLVMGLAQADTNVTVTGKQSESRPHGLLGWGQEAGGMPVWTPGPQGSGQLQDPGMREQGGLASAASCPGRLMGVLLIRGAPPQGQTAELEPQCAPQQPAPSTAALSSWETSGRSPAWLCPGWVLHAVSEQQSCQGRAVVLREHPLSWKRREVAVQE